MPVDRQHKAFVFECDTCDETFNGEPGEDFTDAWASAKRDGWKARKLADEWVRGCPKCGV